MKKLVSLALALVLCLSLSVTAFAETIQSVNQGNNTVTTNVTGEATVSTAPAAKVYYVEVNWSTLNFVYTPAAGTWNPRDLQYEGDTGSWKTASGQNGATLGVNNYSNDNISVTFSGTIDSEVQNIGTTAFQFSGSVNGTYAAGPKTIYLDSAEGVDEYNVPKDMIAVGLSGKPTGDIATGTVLGTLTATIAHAEV